MIQKNDRTFDLIDYLLAELTGYIHEGRGEAMPGHCDGYTIQLIVGQLELARMLYESKLEIRKEASN